MDKQTSVAFVLIGLILIIWLYFNSPAPPPQQPKKKGEAASVEKKDTTQTIPVTPPQNQPAPDIDLSSFGSTQQPEKIITIETDLAKFELTSKGARIRRYFLKRYKTWYHNDIEPKDTNFYNQHVQLVNTSKNGGDFNIIFVTKEGKLVNTASLDFTSSATNYYYRVSGNDSLSIDYSFSSENGGEIKKGFVINGDNYASKINIELDNMEDVISSYRYDLVWSSGLNFVEENNEEINTDKQIE